MYIQNNDDKPSNASAKAAGSVKKKKSTFREYAEALAWALCLALIIRTFLFQAFTIPSSSMENTLLIGDYLLVTKFSYGVKIPFSDKYLTEFDGPEYGDIIVFRFPKNPREDYVKRVVGLPGDVMEMRNKKLYRNGEPVQEGYIQNIRPNYIGELDNMKPYTVPEGYYFAMGDNRDNSSDSRAWGPVERHLIHGKAWRIYWSWDRTKTGVRLDRLGKKLE